MGVPLFFSPRSERSITRRQSIGPRTGPEAPPPSSSSSTDDSSLSSAAAGVAGCGSLWQRTSSRCSIPRDVRRKGGGSRAPRKVWYAHPSLPRAIADVSWKKCTYSRSRRPPVWAIGRDWSSMRASWTRNMSHARVPAGKGEASPSSGAKPISGGTAMVGLQMHDVYGDVPTGTFWYVISIA